MMTKLSRMDSSLSVVTPQRYRLLCCRYRNGYEKRGEKGKDEYVRMYVSIAIKYVVSPMQMIHLVFHDRLEREREDSSIQSFQLEHQIRIARHEKRHVLCTSLKQVWKCRHAGFLQHFFPAETWPN
eukprot:scaffold11368_cov74-Skeletonema_marinoi.AAC.10